MLNSRSQADGPCAPDRRIDLSECDREPIHLLGQIQPHGVLLVLDRDGRTIQRVSANTGPLLGLDPNRLLGRDLAVLLRPEDASALLGRLDTLPAGQPAGQALDLPHAPARGLFEAIAHRWNGVTMVELSPTAVPAGTAVAEAAAVAAEISDRIARADNVFHLTHLVVEAVRRITGYDRVMVYRFHPDWSGEVIAEARRPELAPYLGLRYPASDIPAQARELFRRNLLRVIADVDALPVGLVPLPDPAAGPEMGGPPDLTCSALRSVSRYHIEYLRNMGVAASMTASILVDGALWGMIACHHATARPAPWHQKVAVGQIARRLGQHIGVLSAAEQTQAALREQQRIASLMLQLAPSADPVAALLFGPDRLTAVTDADAAALVCEDTTAAVGLAPPAAAVADFARWLADHQPEGVYATDHLLADYPAAEDFRTLASGVLAAVVCRDPLVCLVCFRGEFLHEVHWSGDPGKPVLTGGEGERLSPRRSFALWRETVRDRSRPWRQEQVEIVAALPSLLMLQAGGDPARLRDAVAAGIAGLGSAGRRSPDLAPLLAELMPDTVSMVLWDAQAPNPAVLAANDRFCRTFGLDRSEVVGQGMEALLAKIGLPEAFLGRDTPLPERFDVWSMTGGHRTMMLDRKDLLQVRGPADSQTISGLTLVDVTRQKRIEDALRAAKLEAEQANRAKAGFLAAASHDLRQPLQAAELFLFLLESRNRDPQLSELVTKLRNAQGALKHTLDSLLEFSRYDAGGVQAEFRAFPIQDLLDQLGEEASVLSREKGLKVRVVRSGAMVWSDPGLLAQIGRNLIANAVRYTQSGGILLGVRRQGTAAALQICDTGIGIPPEHLDRIFDEFYQIHNPERDREKGLGLGLPIVKRIAALLRVKVEVRSAVGRGSVFSVRVPLAPLGERPRAVAVPRSAGAKAGVRSPVLVIDDDAVIRDALRLCLSDWGYEVLTAESTADAMLELSSAVDLPGVVIADYRLRDELTGTEAIEVLREEFATDFPAILLTGDTDPDRLREAARSGLSILFKPVDPAALQAAIRDAMRVA